MKKEKFGRTNPKNRQHATAIQLTDDVKILTPLALLGDEHSFEVALNHIEMVIKAYRSKRLRKSCDKAVAKSKEMDAYMAKNFPEKRRIKVKFKTTK